MYQECLSALSFRFASEFYLPFLQLEKLERHILKFRESKCIGIRTDKRAELFKFGMKS